MAIKVVLDMVVQDLDTILLATLAVLMVVDAVFTAHAIRRFGFEIEANPIIRFIYRSIDFWAAFFIVSILTVTALCMIYFGQMGVLYKSVFIIIYIFTLDSNAMEYINRSTPP